MLCNSRTKWDFIPELKLYNQEDIEVVNEMKIVGFIMRSDMRTCSNTEYLVKKAFKRMWIIRRLKALGCPNKELLVVLREQIISICEVGVAWWGPMITIQESNMLERVLKAGLHIIFQDNYINFKNALILGNLKSLKERRCAQIVTFSKKSYKNPRFQTWFCNKEANGQPPIIETRNGHKNTPLLKPVTCRTQRYARSSLPLMTSILAWHPPLRYSPLNLA